MACHRWLSGTIPGHGDPRGIEGQTVLTIGTACPAGLFVPSLFIGACLGSVAPSIDGPGMDGFNMWVSLQFRVQEVEFLAILDACS